MLAKGQITVTNIDDGKTPFLHQAYKMKDGRFLKHYPVYEASPVNGYKEGDLWHRTDGSQPGYFVANKSNTTLNLNDWTFYANELAYSDTDKFYPKFEGTYSDYNEVASDDQTKYTWKIIKADDGVGIKSVKEYYAISASNVTPPSLQSDWSETPKATNTTNKYLWNYEVYTYSNGDVKETAKRVIGTHGTTGATGNGITSVTNRYLATTLATGVTTATSGWTTTVQKTDPVKKYLWNYEEILYTNGSKIPTTPVIIGTHGEKGDNSVVGLLTNESITLPANKDGLVSNFTGATGIFDVYDGITKKTGSGVEYSLVSQSNITVNINATTGAYSVTAMPTGTTILNGFATLSAIYNGITIEKQLSVSKSLTGATGATGATGPKGATGSQGPKGDVGTSVSSVTEYYLATPLSTGVTTSTSGWSTAIQTMTATNKYLWNYEKINFSDSTSQPTIPVIIGVYGDKGQTGSTGATGRSITSITEHYLATSASSNVTRSTSGWSTTMQTTTPTNKYLWNYETVNWSSGTTPTYVEPIIIGVHGDKGDKGDTGKDGIAGKDGKGINSTVITYMTSTSGTTAPTTGWTPTVPTLTKGQYLWTKTIWTYTDSTTETGYSVSYIAKDGNTGKDGIAGKDGVGISKTTITYAKSTNGTTAPTTGYTTTVPSTNPGDYLWTKTVWTYTDNTDETGYSVGKIGNTGATGATGPQGPKGDRGPQGATGSQGPRGDVGTSITGITEYYLATSASSGVTATTTGWTTSVQTMTATNKYLWNYEKVNFSDGTSQPTVPVIIGAYGDKGATGSTGATGRSITGITEHYLATNLATGVTRSTSGWTTTMQTTTETKRYLWNYETITWSSGTTTTYVEPIVIGVHGLQGPQGATGAQGIQGPPGANGVSQYVHIRYSANSSGNPMTTTPQSDTAYIGMVITTSSTAPTGYASYKWSLFKGPQGSTGPQGIQGPKGANGQTTYTWIRYADTPTSGMNQYPEGKKYIGLAFNKTTQTESSNYSDYKWSLMPQNIEIGGRNLILKTESLEGYRYKTEDKFMNFNIARTTRGETGYLDTFSATTINVADGDTYTASFYARSSVPTQVACHWYSPNTTTSSKSSTGHSSNSADGLSIVTLSADWKRYWVTWTQSTTSEVKNLIVGRNSTTPGAVVEIAGVKLEKGNTATDWTEAPEDTQAKLNEKADQEQVNNALGDINESLEDKIAREEFEKLEKIATEFAKSYEAFVSEGGQYVEDAAKLEERFAQIFLELGANSIDLRFLTTYFRVGKEGLLIGSEDSQIKMLLTNDRLSFQEGSGDNIKEIAYFGGQSFTINSGAIVQDFQIGEHKFTNIGGGHTIVQWTTK